MIVVLDVNETLSDPRPLAEAFQAVGAPASVAARWFAGLLRDGFALSVSGTPTPLEALVPATLAVLLDEVVEEGSLDEAVEHVREAFGALPPHPDVGDGIVRLRSAGHEVATFSNGPATTAAALLERAGVRSEVRAFLSIEQAEDWKPARAAYEHLSSALAAPKAELVLVSAHPWDVDGAAKAGLRTAWLNREGRRHPSVFLPPDEVVVRLTELTDALAEP